MMSASVKKEEKCVLVEFQDKRNTKSKTQNSGSVCLLLCQWGGSKTIHS